MKAYFVPYLVVKDRMGNITFGARITQAYDSDGAIGKIHRDLKADYPNGTIHFTQEGATELTYEFFEYWAKEYGII